MSKFFFGVVDVIFIIITKKLILFCKIYINLKVIFFNIFLYFFQKEFFQQKFIKKNSFLE